MKKFLALALALVLCLGIFAGCTPAGTTDPTGGNVTPGGDAGNNPGGDTSGGTSDKPLAGTYDIKVWVAENAIELTTAQINKFNETNDQGITINATIEAVGEGDASSKIVADVEAAGDIYCFPQDQLGTLIQAGALAQLGNNAAQIVTENNDGGSVACVTSGDALYAYPMTSDNGYFMYYDKSVITDDVDITDLAALVKACEDADRYFSFNLEGSAWYGASFFFATGCTSTWTTNSDGAFVSVNDDWNSDAGLTAAKGMQILVKSKCYLDSSSVSDFEAATPSAVVISGTWAYGDVSAILGDNLGVAELPSFTVDGKTYHLGSYNGCKLMGVKPQTDAVRAAVLHQLAQYLTGETCQAERFDTLAWGPSNLAVQKSDAVQSAPHLAALAAQNNYAVPQGIIPDGWWAVAQTVSTGIKDAATDADIQTVLQTYESALAGMCNAAE